MLARFIIAALAALFVTMAAVRLVAARGTPHPQVRAWLLLGAILGAASAWLFYQG